VDAVEVRRIAEGRRDLFVRRPQRRQVLRGRPMRQRGGEVDVALGFDPLADGDAAVQVEPGDEPVGDS
jgi:hypothetical protein